MRILGGPGLAAGFHIRQISTHQTTRAAAGASGDCGPHPFDHPVVIFTVNASMAGSDIQAVQAVVLYFLYDMGSDEPATVGNSSSQIGYLQGSGQDFTLPDGNADDGQPIPRATIGLVIKLGIGNKSPLFTRQICAQPIAEPLRHHVVLPYGDGILGGAIFLITKHMIESPTEIGITTKRDRDILHASPGE